MNEYTEVFYGHITRMLDDIYRGEDKKITEVSAAMARCIMNGGNVFVFGPGHAGIITEDFFYRAGGLAVINPLFNPCLAPTIRPITLSTDTEVLPGFATNVLKESPLKAGDFLLIHSVAARNPIVVEMAIKAREMGILVGAIISEKFAHSVTSKDPSGKMLYEVVDENLIIDNHGDIGDSCIDIGMRQKAVSTSSITGTFIVANIVLNICKMLQENHVEPPVFASSNIDGGAEINDRLLKEYKDHIFYM